MNYNKNALPMENFYQMEWHISARNVPGTETFARWLKTIKCSYIMNRQQCEPGGRVKRCYFRGHLLL